MRFRPPPVASGRCQSLPTPPRAEGGPSQAAAAPSCQERSDFAGAFLLCQPGPRDRPQSNWAWPINRTRYGLDGVRPRYQTASGSKWVLLRNRAGFELNSFRSETGPGPRWDRGAGARVGLVRGELGPIQKPERIRGVVGSDPDTWPGPGQGLVASELGLTQKPCWSGSAWF